MRVVFTLLLLVLQSAVLAFFFHGKQVPIPSFVLQKINQKYIPDFLVSAEKLTFDGTFHAKKVKLLRLDTTDPLVTIDQLTLTIDWIACLMGQVVLNDCTLQKAHFYCPAIYSPSGQRERVIHHLYGTFHRCGLQWKIPYLHFQLDPFKITAQGVWQPPPTHKKPLDYFSLCSAILLSQPLFSSSFKDPIVDITLQGSAFHISAHIAETLIPNLSLGRQELSLDLLWTEALTLSNTSWAYVETGNWKDQLQVGPLWVTPQQNLLLSTDTYSLRFTTLRAETFGVPLQGTGEVTIDQGMVLTLDPLFLHCCQFHTLPHIKARVDCNPSFQLEKATFSVETGAFTFEDLSFTHVKARGLIDAHQLDLSEMTLTAKDWEVMGSYSQNWDTNHFRFLLTGSLNPSQFNNWLNWAKFWQQFTFDSSHFPQADVDIQGKWGGYDMTLFGSVKGESFSFRNMPVDSFSLQARGRVSEGRGFRGRGHFFLNKHDLAKLPVLEMLFPLLKHSPLTIGTFQLKQAFSSFSVNKEKIHFPNLVLQGPTAKIKAKGDYFWEEERVNFKVFVYPLGKVKIPIVSEALSLLGPLAEAFKVKLTGTMREPEWKMKVLFVPL